MCIRDRHEDIGILKEKERKVIVLYYTYGYRLKEIAVMIRESETNTKSLSRRAKQKLKAMIEEGGLDLSLIHISQIRVITKNFFVTYLDLFFFGFLLSGEEKLSWENPS